jgi:hypothetical protein
MQHRGTLSRPFLVLPCLECDSVVHERGLFFRKMCSEAGHALSTPSWSHKCISGTNSASFMDEQALTAVRDICRAAALVDDVAVPPALQGGGVDFKGCFSAEMKTNKQSGPSLGT